LNARLTFTSASRHFPAQFSVGVNTVGSQFAFKPCKKSEPLVVRGVLKFPFLLFAHDVNQSVGLEAIGSGVLVDYPWITG